jgi:Restriction endonuclease
VVPTWAKYQEDVASFFRDLGYEARTNVTIEGARGKHDVDVLVTFQAAGLGVTWVIECKQWQRPVPKERVLILSGVVTDIGADRGILVAESGYQAGAIRIAEHANITLTSLVDLRENSEEERSRLLNQFYISCIAAVGRRFARLWLWTQPQTRRPAFRVPDLLEQGLRSFELQHLILPRLAANEFPITMVIGGKRVIAESVTELDGLLAEALMAADQELLQFERMAAEAAANAYAILDRLTGAIGRLLATGRSITITTEGLAIAERFVEEMRAIDEAATDLRETAPESVARQVTKLMRHLIDNTYVITDSVSPDWNIEAQALQDLLSALASELDGVAIQPPSEHGRDRRSSPAG